MGLQDDPCHLLAGQEQGAAGSASSALKPIIPTQPRAEDPAAALPEIPGRPKVIPATGDEPAAAMDARAGRPRGEGHLFDRWPCP